MKNIIIWDKMNGQILVNPTNINFVGNGIDFFPAGGDALRLRWIDESEAEKEFDRLLSALKAGDSFAEFESDF